MAYRLQVVLMVAWSSNQYDYRNMKLVHGLRWRRPTNVHGSMLDMNEPAHKGAGLKPKPNQWLGLVQWLGYS